MHFDGRVETQLCLEEVRQRTAWLVQERGVEAIAVCFLHAYANPSNEIAVRSLIEHEFPEVYLSISSEVSPFMKEYERWTTTTVNGYVLGEYGNKAADRTDGDARKGTRQAYFGEAGGYLDCPVFDRYGLARGQTVLGPALIEENESTCVVGVGDKVIVDEYYNLVVEISALRSERESR